MKAREPVSRLRVCAEKFFYLALVLCSAQLFAGEDLKVTYKHRASRSGHIDYGTTKMIERMREIYPSLKIEDNSGSFEITVKDAPDPPGIVPFAITTSIYDKGGGLTDIKELMSPDFKVDLYSLKDTVRISGDYEKCTIEDGRLKFYFKENPTGEQQIMRKGIYYVDKKFETVKNPVDLMPVAEDDPFTGALFRNEITYAKGKKGFLTFLPIGAFSEKDIGALILDEEGKIIWAEGENLSNKLKIIIQDLDSDGIQEIFILRDKHGLVDVLCYSAD